MKLVLSRKGFDSRSGGCLSPYNHKSGKYIWFPIPEKVNSYSNKIRYPDISVKKQYLGGLDGTTISEIYFNLRGNKRVKIREKEFALMDDTDLFAHFDPMLGMPPWIEENGRLEIGKGFGQFNAGSHLEKQNVKEGSVFLFFGGFQSIVDRKISGHYIYGWLKVKRRIETFEEATELLNDYHLNHHPHITKEAFNRGRKNYIFIPEDWLFEDLAIPGCGYFTTLNDRLLLSNSKDTNKGLWKLPHFFYKRLTQVHQRTWLETEDGFCTVKTGIGQEFVTKLTDESEGWLRELFLKNKDNIS